MHQRTFTTWMKLGCFAGVQTKNIFHFKDEYCKAGKLSKQRLTVGLCAGMSREKETTIVTGKSVLQ